MVLKAQMQIYELHVGSERPPANKHDGFALAARARPPCAAGPGRRGDGGIDAAWWLWFTPTPFYKWRNHKNRKSYFLAREDFLRWKEEMDGALRWRRWSVTAIECSTSLTNVPITPACAALRPPAPPRCRRWMCVCVAYDRVMCPGMLVGFISRN